MKNFFILLNIILLATISSCDSGVTIDQTDLNKIASSLGAYNGMKEASTAIPGAIPGLKSQSGELTFTLMEDDETINGITGGWYKSNDYSFLGLTGNTYLRYEDANGNALSADEILDATIREYNLYVGTGRTLVFNGSITNMGVSGENYTDTVTGSMTFTNNTEDASDDFVVNYTSFVVTGNNDDPWIYSSGEDSIIFTAENNYYVGTATMNSLSYTNLTFTGTIYHDVNSDGAINGGLDEQLATFSVAFDGTITITPTTGDAWTLSASEYPKS